MDVPRFFLARMASTMTSGLVMDFDSPRGSTRTGICPSSQVLGHFLGITNQASLYPFDHDFTVVHRFTKRDFSSHGHGLIDLGDIDSEAAPMKPPGHTGGEVSSASDEHFDGGCVKAFVI